MDVRPFTIAIDDVALADLDRRLAATRWPAAGDPTGWGDGTSLDFMRGLVDHWRHRFDWRAVEARLNRLPQFMARVDGLDIHFVHQRGTGPAPLPLVITHGWPGSFIEMERIVPMLADPGAHGGDPADAFHVVAPSLPGYGFSQLPAEPGTGPHRIAELWAALMAGLGYDRFGAQGGDWGSSVSTWLGRRFPDRVLGLHLNYIAGSYRPSLEGAPPPTAEERAFLDQIAGWLDTEGAYSHIQGTKPLSIAYGLADSPAGLAAWITEKFQTWSDCGGEIETAVPLDVLLANIALYWFTDTIGSSVRLYQEGRRRPLHFGPDERVVPPLGIAQFPRELPTPPRSWVERVYDVRRWTMMPKGGHFAALEQPALLAEEIRAFFRPLR